MERGYGIGQREVQFNLGEEMMDKIQQRHPQQATQNVEKQQRDNQVIDFFSQEFIEAAVSLKKQAGQKEVHRNPERL